MECVFVVLASMILSQKKRDEHQLMM